MKQVLLMQSYLTHLTLILNAGINSASQTAVDLLPAAEEPGKVTAQESWLDLDLIRASIEAALPLGLRTVILSGGTPLLHPAIEQIVDLLEARSLHLMIETDGTGLTEPIIAHLRKMAQQGFVNRAAVGFKTECSDTFLSDGHLTGKSAPGMQPARVCLFI